MPFNLFTLGTKAESMNGKETEYFQCSAFSELMQDNALHGVPGHNYAWLHRTTSPSHSLKDFSFLTCGHAFFMFYIKQRILFTS